MTTKAWCSWCMENCDQVVEQVNTMRRDVYNCTKCDARTLLCFTCKIAMTRGSGWDSDCCLVCSDKKNILEKAGHGLFSKKEKDTSNLEAAWQQILEKKAAVVAKYDSPDFVRSEMQRDSEFRKKAIDAGMIRAFLLLVGMTPELRNQVSNFLGWSIITEPYFGDSHAESWDILSRRGQGMITRSNSTTTKLNPFGNNSTYYELLYKVTETVFKFVPMPALSHKDSMQASNVSENTVKNSATAVPHDEKPVHLDPSTNTFTTNKQVALNAEAEIAKEKEKAKSLDQQGEVVDADLKEKERLNATKNTLAIAQLEEFLMAQVHSQQRKTMTKAQRESEDKLTEDSQTAAFKTAVTLIRSKTGLSNAEAVKYGVGVARQVFNVPGKWGLTLMSMQALQVALPTTAVFMGPAIAGLTVLMGPLAIIGLAQLLWSGVNAAIGPTLWSLYGPLVLMTNQRIILALQDMQVEKFY